MENKRNTNNTNNNNNNKNQYLPNTMNRAGNKSTSDINTLNKAMSRNTDYFSNGNNQSFNASNAPSNNKGNNRGNNRGNNNRNSQFRNNRNNNRNSRNNNNLRGNNNNNGNVNSIENKGNDANIPSNSSFNNLNRPNNNRPNSNRSNSNNNNIKPNNNLNGLNNNNKNNNNLPKNNRNNNSINSLLQELNNNENSGIFSNNNLNNLNKNGKEKNNHNRASDAIYNATTSATQSSQFWMIVQVILIGIVFIILINTIKYFYTTYENYKQNTPWILEGNKNAKHALNISQNPDNNRTPKLHKSSGQKGIEFSYVVWLMIDDFNYKQTEWKHVFHKGNESAYPTIAPGVWIHPNKNIIRVYMNTLKKIYEYVDIDNIPLRKWMHLTIMVKNKTLYVYINGGLKTTLELSSLPRQNNEDLWLNLNGGFEGYMSRMRYYNYAISISELSDIIKSGPADSACIDSGEAIPPYLDDKWWF